MDKNVVLKKSIVNKLGALGISAIIATASAGCSKIPPSPGAVGTHLPAYAAASLNGDSTRLSDLKGSVVLLNVWATWCIPCRKEIPELQALHQEYSGRGLKVVGVSVDEPAADADVADFIHNYSVTYTILRDGQDRISDLLALPGVPASFLIDRSGTVRWRRLGALTWDDAEFLAALRETLQSRS